MSLGHHPRPPGELESPGLAKDVACKATQSSARRLQGCSLTVQRVWSMAASWVDC